MSYFEGTACPTEDEMRQSITVRFVWHMHHDELFETTILNGFEERTADIKAHKKNWELRLQLMKYVQMSVPDDLQSAAQKMWETLRALGWLDRTEPHDTPKRETARVEWEQARAVYATLERRYLPMFYAAHADECPDCKWDGHTLFPYIDNAVSTTV